MTDPTLFGDGLEVAAKAVELSTEIDIKVRRLPGDPPEEDPGTQVNRVYRLLYTKRVVCGVTFLEMHIPRYAARIAELRKQGYDIVNVDCPYGTHSHNRNIATYELR